MSEEIAQSGVTEASPASTSGVTEAAPTSTNESPSSAPAISGYGMGPGGSDPQPQRLSSDDLFKEYGEEIFQHDRFKELVEYKNKFKDFEPTQQFVEQAGGLDQLQAMSQHFGPLWNHLINQGDNAQQIWGQLVPYFQAVLQGKEIPAFGQPQMQPQEGDDPYGDEDESEGFNKQLDPIKQELDQLKQHNAKQQEAQIQQMRQGNYEKYETLLDELVGDDPVLQAMKVPVIGPIIVNELGRYMPKGPNGQMLNPLDQFTPEALKSAFEKTVLPVLKTMEGAILNKHKKRVEEGGPVLPNTSTQGTAPVGNAAPASRHDKAALLAQSIKAGRLGIG